jgi:predicted XRE-type DNA-binding protein
MNEQTEHVEYTVGSGNVFADLGFENPEEEQAKAAIVIQIAQTIAERGLTQMQAAEVLDIDQPKVSRLLSGRYAGFTLDRLLRLLLALDKDVSIVIAPKQAERGHIIVQAS